MLCSTVLLTVTLAVTGCDRSIEMPTSAVATTPSPIRETIAHLDLVAPESSSRMDERETQAGNSRGMGTGKRVLFTLLAGAAGFYTGGVIGSYIDGDCGGCDDPGLKGALIGAPTGAATAMIVTWVLTGR